MKISVVIPAYNEEKYITKTLESLNNQTHKAWEIIVVDNNSTDKTANASKNMRAKIIQENKKGIGYARRAGFNSASGDIIATTDADTILPKNWLLKINETFNENKDIVAIGGPYMFDTKKKKILIKIISKIWIWGDSFLNSGNNIPGVNMAVKKHAYEAVGGFRNNKYFEDLDLSLRLKKYGKILFLKDLLVTTSFRRYENQGFFRTAITYMKNYLKYLKNKSEIKMKDIRE